MSDSTRNPIVLYRRWARKNIDISALPIVMLTVLILLTVVTSGRFLSAPNLSAMAFQLPELGLLALAMMITMVTGGINLSTISSANLSGVIMALLLTRVVPADISGLSGFFTIVLVIVVGLSVSLVLGLINGALIAYVGISPVLTTLGTMIFYEGLTLAITRGFVISGFPTAFFVIGHGSVIGIPFSFLLFILCAFLISLLYRRRPLGRQLYMLGSNDTATRFSAINTKLVLLKTYAISGLLCGIASVIMVSRFNSANARNGASFLLLSVLICVLGGTDPFGGFGRVSGLILALFTLQMISSGLNLLGVISFVTVSLWGIILILVIAYRYFSLKQRDNELIMRTAALSSAAQKSDDIQ